MKRQEVFLFNNFLNHFHQNVNASIKGNNFVSDERD